MSLFTFPGSHGCAPILDGFPSALAPSVCGVKVAEPLCIHVIATLSAIRLHLLNSRRHKPRHLLWRLLWPLRFVLPLARRCSLIRNHSTIHTTHHAINLCRSLFDVATFHKTVQHVHRRTAADIQPVRSVTQATPVRTLAILRVRVYQSIGKQRIAVQPQGGHHPPHDNYVITVFHLRAPLLLSYTHLLYFSCFALSLHESHQVASSLAQAFRDNDRASSN